MTLKTRIILIAVAAALYVPALIAGRAPWPAVAQQQTVRGTETPLYFEGFINPPQMGSMSHVASLAPLPGGGMAAAWYSGSREGAPDVAIYLSRLDPKTGRWDEPRAIVDRLSATKDLGRYVKKVGNALLHTDSDGTLWLFYSTISEGGWSMSTLSYTHSTDQGLSWAKSTRMLLSPALNLTNNVKNKAVALNDGSFLIPAYHELARKFSEVIRFDPENLTYEKRRMGNTQRKLRAIQPALVTGPKGSLTAVFRNMGREKPLYAYLSKSNDSGWSWSPLEKTDLLNPNSGLDAIRLSNGHILAAANDLEHGRNRLSLLASKDGGMSWRRLVALEDSPHASGEKFSYPFMERDNQGNIHLAYTYRRENIRHVVFNEAWLHTLDTGSKMIVGGNDNEGK